MIAQRIPSLEELGGALTSLTDQAALARHRDAWDRYAALWHAEYSGWTEREREAFRMGIRHGLGEASDDEVTL